MSTMRPALAGSLAALTTCLVLAAACSSDEGRSSKTAATDVDGGVDGSVIIISTGGATGAGAGSSTGAATSGGAGGLDAGMWDAAPDPCGDGVVAADEICDIGIPTGESGACPDRCASDDACVPVRRSGTGCQAECVTADAITAVDDGSDACCPSGATAQDDPDCAVVCGDGRVGGNERCDTAIAAGDPGACPTTCTPVDACETATLTGNNCRAQCVTAAVTAVDDGTDGCCPAGANADTDSNCTAECGNTVIETSAGETCEGNCPTSCTSSDACQPRSLTGDAALCTSACVDDAPVTVCTSGDGCCPSGCDWDGSTGDDDCPNSNLCGNGSLDTGERCDDSSSTACPTACTPSAACKAANLQGAAGACTARCVETDIVAVGPADGCCPPGANANNDTDCGAVCGNGAVEGSETCDGNCPTSCSTVDPCNPQTLTGTGCQVSCLATTIDTCAAGDSCCPAGCDGTSDPDCGSTCPNGIVEPGEECEPSGPNDPNCLPSCVSAATDCLDQATARGEDRTDPCVGCLCGDTGCRDELDTCFNDPTLAVAGPRVGVSQGVLCGEVVDCVRTTGCQVANYGANHCVCGSRSLLGCLGTQDGPCAAEFKAAGETSSVTGLLNAQTDPSLALGKANLLSTCQTANCTMCILGPTP